VAARQLGHLLVMKSCVDSLRKTLSRRRRAFLLMKIWSEARFSDTPETKRPCSARWRPGSTLFPRFHRQLDQVVELASSPCPFTGEVALEIEAVFLREGMLLEDGGGDLRPGVLVRRQGTSSRRQAGRSVPGHALLACRAAGMPGRLEQPAHHDQYPGIHSPARLRPKLQTVGDQGARRMLALPAAPASEYVLSLPSPAISSISTCRLVKPAGLIRPYRRAGCP